MAFVLDAAKKPHSGTVAWSIPGDEEPLEISFKAVFKRLTQDGIKELLDDIRIAWGGVTDPESLSEEDRAVTPKTNREMVLRVFCGWDKVERSDGEPLTFDDASRDDMLSIQGAEVAVLNSWFESITGGNAKN
jgi:hypothetical protein